MNVRLVVFKQCAEISGGSLDVLREAALGSERLRGEVDLSLRDYYAEDDELVLRETLAGDPAVVALSGYVWGLERCLELARRLKQVAGDRLVVLGGPELSSIERDVLARHPAVDVVVHGEGEEAFRELLEALVLSRRPPQTAALGAVPGLSLRLESGELATTGERALRRDVNACPSPYLTGRYFEARRGRLADHGAVVEQYRGCPFRCAFCFWARGCAEVRWFDEARVLAELDALERAGVPELFFADAAFSLDRARAKRVVRRLASARFRRVDLHVELGQLDDELCELLGSVASLVVNIGVQAVKRETLQQLHREPMLRRHRERLERLLRGVARVRLQAILGLPTDRPEDFRATLDDGVTLEPGPELQLFHLQVLPGSEYWARNAELGLGASPAPPHFVHGSERQGAERLQRMKLDAWLVTVLHNRELLHFLGRLYAGALGLAPAAATARLLWRLADRLWVRGEHRDLPDGVVRTASTAGMAELLDTAHALLLEAGCSPDAARDALGLDQALGRAALELRDPRRGALRVWPAGDDSPVVAIPWSRAAPPDPSRERWVAHGLPLGDLRAGRTTAPRTERGSLVWATGREIHLLEVPGSFAALAAACTGSEPLAELAERALRPDGARVPMAEAPGRRT